MINLSPKNQKLMIILNSLTTIFGIIAFILLLNSGVTFGSPIIWFICFIVLSSISSLGTIIKKQK